MFAYDLEVDPAALAPLDGEALAARLCRSPKPVRRVAVNSAPVMSTVDAFPSFHGLAPDVLVARAEAVRSDGALCARLIEAMARDPYPESEHVEQRIHVGFASNADRARMRAFHAADWPGRAALVGAFEDARLAELGRRLVFHHAPNHLPGDDHRAITIELARRMTGHGHGAPPWLTLSAADEEAVRMLADCSAEEAVILDDLRRHYAAEVARCAPHVG